MSTTKIPATPTITLNGEVFPLATNLRVAYKIQGQNDHKPYSKVFEELPEMGVERQIDMVYAAFQCANPEATATWNNGKFRDYCLDHMNISELMDSLQAVIKGVMGVTDADDAAAAAAAADASEDAAKN